jgi:hypothetical protein
LVFADQLDNDRIESILVDRLDCACDMQDRTFVFLVRSDLVGIVFLRKLLDINVNNRCTCGRWLSGYRCRLFGGWASPAKPQRAGWLTILASKLGVTA